MTTKATITQPKGEQIVNFGQQIAISQNGTRLLVTAQKASSQLYGVVYLYERSANSQPWDLLARLQPGSLALYKNKSWQAPIRALQRDAFGRPIIGYQFGSALAISNDGKQIAVGAPAAATDHDSTYVGAVYLYQQQKNGRWQISRPITNDDFFNQQRFGASIAIKGNWLLIGAPDKPNGGGAYLLDTKSFWASATPTFGYALHHDVPNLTDGAQFGSAVALNDTNIFVGAPNDGQATGTVHIGSLKHYTAESSSSPAWRSLTEAKTPGFGCAIAITASQTLIVSPKSYALYPFGSADQWLDKPGQGWPAPQTTTLTDEQALNESTGALWNRCTLSDNTIVLSNGANAWVSQQTDTTTHDWSQLAKLAETAVGPVTASPGEIYVGHPDKNEVTSLSAKSWRRLPGAATDVANGWCIGTDEYGTLENAYTNHTIFKREKVDAGGWKPDLEEGRYDIPAIGIAGSYDNPTRIAYEESGVVVLTIYRQDSNGKWQQTKFSNGTEISPINEPDSYNAKHIGDGWLIDYLTAPGDKYGGGSIYKLSKDFTWQKMPFDPTGKGPYKGGLGPWLVGGTYKNPYIVDNKLNIYRWENEQWAKLPPISNVTGNTNTYSSTLASGVGDGWFLFGRTDEHSLYASVLYRWVIEKQSWEEMTLPPPPNPDNYPFPYGIAIGGTYENPYLVTSDNKIYRWE